MYRILRLVILICFFSSCSEPKSNREKWRDKTLVLFAKHMKGKGLRAAGIGGGCTVEKKINLMGVTFDYNKVMSIDEARELIVECSNELLRMVNSDPNAAQYFENFPIKENILEVAVIGKSSESITGNIKFVFTNDGRIIYIADDESRMPKPVIHQESFAEAQEIVKRGKVSLLPLTTLRF